MELEALDLLEKRIENIEKSLGIFEDENFYLDNKKDKNFISLTSKLSFVENKTKELYMAQIKNLIEKGQIHYIFYSFLCLINRK